MTQPTRFHAFGTPPSSPTPAKPTTKPKPKPKPKAAAPARVPDSTHNSDIIAKIQGLAPAMLAALGFGDPAKLDTLIESLATPDAPAFTDWRQALTWSPEIPATDTADQPIHLTSSDIDADHDPDRVATSFAVQALLSGGRAGVIPPVTDQQRIKAAAKLLQKRGPLADWIPDSQRLVTLGCLRGEEGEGFAAIVHTLAERIRTLPRLYAQDGKGDDAIVYLHYFYGGSDWYITEHDTSDERTGQCFGYVILNGDTRNAELGYISLPDLFSAVPMVNLDYHFEPRPLREVKPHLAEDPETAAEIAAYGDAAATIAEYEAISEFETAGVERFPALLGAVSHAIAVHHPDRVVDLADPRLPEATPSPVTWTIPAPSPDHLPLMVILDLTGDAANWELTLIHYQPDAHGDDQDPALVAIYQLTRQGWELTHFQTPEGHWPAVDPALRPIDPADRQRYADWCDTTWSRELWDHGYCTTEEKGSGIRS